MKIEKNLGNRAWCDVCWLRFGLWGYLVTTITSHHNKKSTKLITVSLADSTDDCTGIHTGNDASLGSEKVPTTPTTPTAKRQDLDQERLPTRNTSLESQHILAKYIRYLKAAQGEVSYGNWLRDFSQFDGIQSSIENVVISTFQTIQNYHAQRHASLKFRISGKLQSCKFTGVSYITVII